MISQVHLGSGANFTMQSFFDSSQYELFFLSVEIAAALWVHIQAFEITLRAFINKIIKEAYDSESWLDIPKLLAKHELFQVTKVRSTRSRKGLNRFQAISELSLSFWIDLLSHKYHNKIWVHLAKALPHYNGSREDFYNKAREIRNLRNSIAHHGPIMRRNLIRDHAYLGELTAILDPELAREVEKRSRVLDLLLNARLVGSGGGI
jgi:hypothetical protein